MADLSMLIPARNEMFLVNTVNDILENIEGDTEIIVVCDGAWPDPPGLKENARLSILYYPEAIGQRAATNRAAAISSAKFIMKVDAHCAFDKGFDVKLMADCEYDWTVIPRMYNLHVFDWFCNCCHERSYQGPKKCQPCEAKECEGCNYTNVEMALVWKPRLSRRTDYARFDHTLHFQYWGSYENALNEHGQKRKHEEISDVMCSVGAGWMMHRERFWELGGMDEHHGSWGQMGVEVACKTWLSGGRQVVNKKTWFSHLFRTQPGFGFPYPNPGIDKARDHSRRIWKLHNPKELPDFKLARRPLQWIIDKFSPIPDWPESNSEVTLPTKSKGVVYYTENKLDEKIAISCRKQLQRACGDIEIISVSLKPIDFGRNITLDLERGTLTMFKQILAGLEASTTEIVFLCEHDVLYHPSHFEFRPEREDVYYYNENTWKVDYKSGHALFYFTKQTSGLCSYRELLLGHYKRRVDKVSRDGFSRHMGYEPGCHMPPRGVDSYKAERWMSELPNLDIRHTTNLTANRWDRSQFRNPNACLGWTEADAVPGWGKTLGRFDQFLAEVYG